MGRSIVHMCINVRGVLKNWKSSEWRDCVTDRTTGRTLKPEEVHDGFLDELAQGHEVIPFGEPCKGFDYAGGGCPGHPVAEESVGA